MAHIGVRLRYKGVLLGSRGWLKILKNKEIRTTTAAKSLRAAESFCRFIITCSLLTPAHQSLGIAIARRTFFMLSDPMGLSDGNKANKPNSLSTKGTRCILGDPGQIVRARESLNGRENMARRKVKNGEKSPWGQCLTRPVPNGRRRSGFWLVPEKHKFSSFRSLLFFVPYFSARLDFPSPPLSAPGSPRMNPMVTKRNVHYTTNWPTSVSNSSFAKRKEAGERPLNAMHSVFIALVWYILTKWPSNNSERQ